MAAGGGGGRGDVDEEGEEEDDDDVRAEEEAAAVFVLVDAGLLADAGTAAGARRADCIATFCDGMRGSQGLLRAENQSAGIGGVSRPGN